MPNLVDFGQAIRANLWFPTKKISPGPAFNIHTYKKSSELTRFSATYVNPCKKNDNESISQSVRLFVCLSVCLSIYLSIYLYDRSVFFRNKQVMRNRRGKYVNNVFCVLCPWPFLVVRSFLLYMLSPTVSGNLNNKSLYHSRVLCHGIEGGCRKVPSVQRTRPWDGRQGL